MDHDLYSDEDMFKVGIKDAYLDSKDLVRLDFEPLEPKEKYEGEELQIFPKEARIKGRSKEKF